MKKFTYALLITFSLFAVAHAQNVAVAPIAKYPYSIYKKVHDPNLQDHVISILVKGDVEKIKNEVKDLGGVFKYAAGNIACVRIPVSRISILSQKPFVERIEGSDFKIEVLNDQLILNTNAYLVQQGVNLPQAYNGEGVVMGIIDEGIDFNHKDLRNPDGTTRIKWLWDQRLQYDDTYTPQPYGYGQNWTAAQIDNLEAGAVVDHDYSHGTHVAGIAAGNGLALNNYKGIAPKSDIVFVAVSTNTSDDNFLTNMVDAVEYVFNKADSLGKPCSINISMGTYFGSHDAMDTQAEIIGNLVSAKTGRFIACAAGNEGAAPIHLQTIVRPDSCFTWFGGYGSSQPLYFQLWADTQDISHVEWMIGADQTSPNFSYRGGTPFRFVMSQFGYRSETVYNGLNRIGKVDSYIDSSRGRYSIECLITPDSTNYKWRLMTRGSGKFDLWSFDLVSGGLPDSATYPIITKYKLPDTNQTMVSSFTCSSKVITVGSYVNRNSYADMNLVIQRDTNLVPGALSAFSSHGPTRDGRIKPDIVSAGQWVLSCAAQYVGSPGTELEFAL